MGFLTIGEIVFFQFLYFRLTSSCRFECRKETLADDQNIRGKLISSCPIMVI